MRICGAELTAKSGKVCVGVRGGIRTHGPRIHTTSAFTAVAFTYYATFVVWTVPLP